MSDFKLTAGSLIDISVTANDFETDSGIESAALMSLFLDARDPEAKGEYDETGGYWADEFGAVPYGSLLWTLARDKPVESTARRAEGICKDAFKWMVSFGLLERTEIACSFEQSPEATRLIIKADLFKTKEKKLSVRYALNWSEYAARS